MVERVAKLFEAGSYPDKGIEITQDDLELLARGFAEVPVRVEHTDTPFDGMLGCVKKIWRKGRELFGSIGFTPEAWALIDSAGARKVSVGIKRDKSAITEVSLVKNPRIDGAVVFDSESVGFEAEFVRKEGRRLKKNDEQATFAQRVSELEERNGELERRMSESKADEKIGDWRRRGKITFAASDAAKALLMDGGDAVVCFGEETLSVAQMFERFVEAMPCVVDFGEQAACATGETPDFSAQEMEMFKKLGVDEDSAARMLRGGKG